tara:strand:- start:185 stop:1663 length:1479 start_codon:yes stop_codon:yes gene_type:complete
MVGPVAGVNLGVTDPAAVREIEKEDVAFSISKAELLNVQEEAKLAIASREMGEKITERPDPMTGVRRPMSGYEFAGLSDLATARADQEYRVAQTLALGNVNNWSTSKTNRLHQNLLQGVEAALGLSTDVFTYNVDRNGLPTNISTGADATNLDNAVLALSGYVMTKQYENNRQANDGTVMDVIISGRRPDQFAKTLIDIFDGEGPDTIAVRNIINTLNAKTPNSGTNLIAKIRGLLTTPTSTETLPNANEQDVSEEGSDDFNPDGLGQRRPTELAATTPTVPPPLPQVTPEAATDFRGMPIENIGSNLADIYERIETRTSRFSSRSDLTLTQSENLKAMEKFLGNNRRNLNLKLKDVSKVLKKYERLNKEAAEGVRVTPQLVKELIEDTASPYETTTPTTERAAAPPVLTAAKRTQNWTDQVGQTQPLSTNKDSDIFNKQRRSFIAYLISTNVNRSKGTELWDKYIQENKGKEVIFSQESVDSFVRTQMRTR